MPQPENPFRSALVNGVERQAYGEKVQGITSGVTQQLQQSGSNLDFESAVAGYEKLKEEQKTVLDAGLIKLRECNLEFGILAQPKYIDIVLRTIDNTDLINGKGGNLITDTVFMAASVAASSLNGSFGGGDSPNNGDSENVDPEGAYAKGGILTKPHIGLVAEAGPEVVIPLSGAYKNNGISLWEKAGYLLGTLPKHAEGGIFGEIDEEKNGRAYFSLANNKEQEENSSQWISNMTAPVQVNLGGMTFNFHGAEAKDQESIMNVIKQQMPTIADEIAGTIAVNIQRIFSNMKKETV